MKRPRSLVGRVPFVEGHSGLRFDLADRQKGIESGECLADVLKGLADQALSPVPVIVVGHCCESGDLLTPAPGDPEALRPVDWRRSSLAPGRLPARSSRRRSLNLSRRSLKCT